MTLSIFDKSNKEIWKTDVTGHQGFNQYRWDLVVKKQTSDYPYFIHYDKFIEAGTYTMKISSGDSHLEQPFEIVKGESPYIVRGMF